MLQSSARLLRLLALFQSRATWTGAELTSRLEITGRTLRRDVDRLRTLGYPVHSTSGPAGGYMLGAGASLPPLMLENDEGLAIAIALHGAGGDVSGVADAGQRALAKLDKVLPTRIRKRLDALRASIVRAPDADGGPKIDMGIVDRLAAACSEHRTVRLRYSDRGGKATGAMSSRTAWSWSDVAGTSPRGIGDGATGERSGSTGSCPAAMGWRSAAHSCRAPRPTTTWRPTSAGTWRSAPRPTRCASCCSSRSPPRARRSPRYGTLDRRRRPPLPPDHGDAEPRGDNLLAGHVGPAVRRRGPARARAPGRRGRCPPGTCVHTIKS